jgi:hypothetical protein
MFSFSTGNRLTDNALTADDGRALIARATSEIEKMFGWRPVDERVIFSGLYYDSTKVGSFLTRVTNQKGEYAVLKLQLRPLPFDEGLIMRHVQNQITTNRVRLPALLADAPWEDVRGYGYLIMEDLSHLPHLWATRPTEQDFQRHTIFLSEFMHHVLPIAPYLPVPQIGIKEKTQESFAHFYTIAQASHHRHIDFHEIETMKKAYLNALEGMTFEGFHFTHGHLSGHEIVEDRKTDSFILFANLLWSFRPSYYEVVFPLWVDLMGIRDIRISREDLLSRIDRWIQLWKEIENVDLSEKRTFWFSILERSMMTTMLDLGASEWRDSEVQEKQALLDAWKDTFYWILEEKIR